MPKILTDEDIAKFRERLCAAALPLFAERGLGGVTMRDLAAAVGVSPMTPYRYFKDKDEILAAVRARAFDRHAQTLEQAYRESPKAARPGAVARAYIRFALENPEAYKLMFDVHQPNAAEYPDLVRAGERSRRTMMLQMEDEAPDAETSPTPSAVFTAHMYWSALHGPLMLALSGMLPGEITAEALAGALLRALDTGLRGAARPGLLADDVRRTSDRETAWRA